MRTALGFYVVAMVSAAMAAQSAEIKIVTTTTDVADITRAIVGELAEVSSITTGREDAHALTAKPSFIMRARDADVWMRIGMDLEIGWEPVILRDARNPRIMPGAPGHVDVSTHILRLEVPERRVTCDQGHVHPAGNPHYWLDPLNGRIVAATIAARLSVLYPQHSDVFEANLRRFEKGIDTRMFGGALVGTLGGEALWLAALENRLDAFLDGKGATGQAGGWYAAMRPHRGKTLVTYHRSWSYLAERFGLQADIQLEPKPGIPPTAKHLATVVDAMKARQARAVLLEPFYTRKAAEFVAERTGASVIVMPTMTGGTPEAASYLVLLDTLVAKLSVAL